MIDYSEGDHVFSQIVAMEITESGDLIVLDAGERAVTVWDTDGNEIHRWGRQGEGPVEFMNPGALSENSARLAITDGTAVGVFDIDGTVVETHRLSGTQMPLRPVVDSSGRVSVLMFDFFGDEMRLQRLGDDQVLWRTTVEDFLEQRLFRPRPALTVLSGDRAVVGMEARYVLDVIDLASGAVLGQIERGLAPRAISPSFQRKVREYLVNPGDAPPGWSSVVGAPGRAGLQEDVVAELEFPDAFPSVVHAFRGPPAESVWVRRGLGVDDEFSPPVDPPDEATPMWDIFDAASYEFVRTVTLPRGFIPYAGDATRLAGVQKDAFDTQAVRVLRIHPADDTSSR